MRWESRKYIDRLYITYSHNLNKQDEFIGPDMPVRDKVENINRWLDEWKLHAELRTDTLMLCAMHAGDKNDLLPNAEPELMAKVGAWMESVECTILIKYLRDLNQVHITGDTPFEEPSLVLSDSTTLDDTKKGEHITKILADLGRKVWSTPTFVDGLEGGAASRMTMTRRGSSRPTASGEAQEIYGRQHDKRTQHASHA